MCIILCVRVRVRVRVRVLAVTQIKQAQYLKISKWLRSDYYFCGSSVMLMMIHTTT